MKNATSNKPTSVLIVGSGPVGLTLATELVRYGVDIRIVEKAAKRTDQSRALAIWSRTLELFDRGMGAAAFVEAGLKAKRVSIMNGDDLIGRIEMGTVATPYPYALMIPQSETERLLEERLQQQGVSVQRNVEVTGITQVGDGIEAVLTNRDGSQETVSASWLVGCDGAHSVVRHSLGVPFSGETLPSDWVLGDVEITGYPHGTDVTVYWHREGVVAIFPIAERRYRVLCDVPPAGAEEPAPPTVEQLQELLDQRGSAGMMIGSSMWLAGFRINDRKVAEYRHGRIFLAGDAAHIHSPAGGQGMNTGMQDAFNLAWKLAMVVHGSAGSHLLDSYCPERGYVGDQVLKAAGRLTKAATLQNPIAQHVRNYVVHSVLGFSPAQHAISEIVTEVAIHYPHSPLNGQALNDGPRPGTRVKPVLGQRSVGSGPVPRFALFADTTAELNELAQSFDALVDPYIWPSVREGTIWLIRPDGYVACASETPAGIHEYLSSVMA